ncbi:MAG: hypothetical protein AMJ81_07075 [Phycisphaerae bacterium SM23_33]|jgi:formiminotetrahydrofolate cyclodeaminase|nr:MAG: hypothetical protein AMJ81_07075 [Phycisphaerae bacterium SM23_33]
MSAEQKAAPPGPTELLGLSVRDFQAATASKTPIPGGGSVAGVVGGLAASLGEMVLAFTRGKKAYAEHAAEHEALAVRLARARGMFADLTSDDASAYSLYQEASRCQDDTKQAQMATALAAAINVPREMTALSLSLLEDLKALGQHCNPYLLTDLAAAAVLAEATVKLSDYNVRVNAVSVSDKQQGQELRQVSARDVDRAAKLRQAVEEIVSKHV